jgi:hypothetical protein
MQANLKILTLDVLILLLTGMLWLAEMDHKVAVL